MAPQPLIVVTRRAGPGAAAPPDAMLTLPFELRQRSRLRARLDDGREVALMLERGNLLRGGDRLVSDCGIVIGVQAGKEPVSRARTDSAQTLARVAYHLGNRHVPVQVEGDEVRYLRDHVLDELVTGLGLGVEHAELSFEPEAGAYGHGGHGGHGHAHD